MVPIEFFHRASDLKLGSFEDRGLASNFQSHYVLLQTALLVDLVHICFDHGTT